MKSSASASASCLTRSTSRRARLLAQSCRKLAGSGGISGWRSLGKGDNAMNSMLYEIVWAGNVSLFFKAFQHGRPNSNEEKVRPYRSPRTDRHAVDGNRPAIFPDVT